MICRESALNDWTEISEKLFSSFKRKFYDYFSFSSANSMRVWQYCHDFIPVSWGILWDICIFVLGFFFSSLIYSLEIGNDNIGIHQIDIRTISFERLPFILNSFELDEFRRWRERERRGGGGGDKEANTKEKANNNIMRMQIIFDFKCIRFISISYVSKCFSFFWRACSIDWIKWALSINREWYFRGDRDGLAFVVLCLYVYYVTRPTLISEVSFCRILDGIWLSRAQDKNNCHWMWI